MSQVTTDTSTSGGSAVVQPGVFDARGGDVFIFQNSGFVQVDNRNDRPVPGKKYIEAGKEWDGFWVEQLQFDHAKLYLFHVDKEGEITGASSSPVELDADIPNAVDKIGSNSYYFILEAGRLKAGSA